MLDFSKVSDRRGWRSKKWSRFNEDVLPLPVADMDCAIAEPIEAALAARVAHGIFGYDHPPVDAIDVFLQHCQRRYDWTVDPSWVVPVAGVVPAQFAATRAFSKGGKIAIPNPIYHSFPRAPDIGHAEAVSIPSVIEQGRETIDLTALESCMQDPDNAGLSLLCNPHNPGGAVYRIDELNQIAAMAATHQNVLVSDEIWADLILDDLTHHPMAKVSPEWGVSILAATKTWNIAGLALAFTVIPNAELRSKFEQALMGYPEPSYMAWIATTTAYSEGEVWRQALLSHLRDQRQLMQDTIDRLPGLSMTQLQGTYLAWVDCRSLNRAGLHAECVAAGLGPDDGAPYGKPGFLRFNLACSRELLLEALERFSQVVK